jgi:hypothetical protein
MKLSPPRKPWNMTTLSISIADKSSAIMLIIGY